MLDFKKLVEELESRKGELQGYDIEASSAVLEYAEKLQEIGRLDRTLNATLPAYSGCRILEEGPFIKRFGESLKDRKSADEFALKALEGRSVAAADGSQVFPDGSLSLPVGLAQASVVYNGYDGRGSHGHFTRMRLVTPESTPGDIEPEVSLARFELEADCMIEHMKARPGSLMFMDGSLVLSFISQADEKSRLRYADKMAALLQASEALKTPLAAYTDMSQNKDLVSMMRLAFRLSPTSHLTDTYLLAGKLGWGDRTRVFQCDRDDRSGYDRKSVLDLYGNQRDNVSFFYIQSGPSLPSKVEIPVWCHEHDLTDQIADIIRAQCIIRPGYPDIIHRAHAQAKISQGEAEAFEQMLSAFARQSGIKIYSGQKEFNKRLG